MNVHPHCVPLVICAGPLPCPVLLVLAAAIRARQKPRGGTSTWREKATLKALANSSPMQRALSAIDACRCRVRTKGGALKVGPACAGQEHWCTCLPSPPVNAARVPSLSFKDKVHI